MRVGVRDAALIAALGAGLLAAVAWSPIRVRLRLTVRGLRVALAVEVGVLWGLYRASIGPGGGARGRPGERGPGGTGVEHLPEFLRMLKNATCERLAFKLVLGTGDAASTGVLAGSAWGIAALAVSLARAGVRRWRCVPAVSVIPSFHREILESDLEMVLTVRMGRAALAVARAAMSNARRRARGRVRIRGTR